MFATGARRLRQLGVGGGGVNCQLAPTFSGADSVYACNGGQGRYVVISGYPDGELVVRSLAVYLTQPRNRQPPSPSSPVSCWGREPCLAAIWARFAWACLWRSACPPGCTPHTLASFWPSAACLCKWPLVSTRHLPPLPTLHLQTPPPPPPALSESQYVATLLLGGNVSQFSNQGALLSVRMEKLRSRTCRLEHGTSGALAHLSQLVPIASCLVQRRTRSSCWRCTTGLGARRWRPAASRSTPRPRPSSQPR